MKKFLFSAAVVLSLTACLKTKDYPPDERVLVTISFANVNTPDTVKTTDTVVTRLRITAPDQCYRYEGLDTRNSGPNQFDIQAIGSKPNPALPLPTCDPFPYSKDTTFKFRLTTPGKYTLRYYNGTTLMQADTLVMVPN
ncbi:hypothetical protein [Flavihumibacter sp. CACIAM 22H1]|uniref:hypothetical protein n=1 Tax=Flavihumibacter sp. CACIAM 22H1 TaxID=1812911 RepID=UPI0007A8A873|nr:hypothetical protein [Flavihumibacter sp. CACIAM 22H1]KYP13551.1 MAG: hypothetical protein A1D16_17490 [Flavihumibacter sp. CACIAM 22H1]